MATLQYPARIWQGDDGLFQVRFLDLPGAMTEGTSHDDAAVQAREALTGYLASLLDRGRPIPRPSKTAEADLTWIAPEPEVATPIMLRWAREDADMTLAQLAEKVGVTYQSLQRLERAGANPSIKTLSKVAKALGRDLQVSL